jgi:hypothetical protein
MDRWQYGDYARLFFLPMLKILVAMGTNSLKIIMANLTHKLDPVITQKVLKIFL